MNTNQNSIVLYVDLVRVLWNYDAVLCERKKFKPNFSVGDILPVRETWRYRFLPYGRRIVEFMSDVKYPAGKWNYAPKMPLSYAKHFLRVSAIEEISEKDYKNRCFKEVFYNNHVFSCKISTMPVEFPFDLFFREGIAPPPVTPTVWLVTYEPVK